MVKTANNDIKSVTTKAAKRIKDFSNPQIAPTSYDRNDFKRDIPAAKQLNSEEIKQANETLREDSDLTQISTTTFPTVDISSYAKATNELMRRSISQSAAIKEIGDNVPKRNFASQGMETHSRNPDEHCAFCGGLLTPERWALLDNYFSNAEKP
jgi:hypothetical protein